MRIRDLIEKFGDNPVFEPRDVATVFGRPLSSVRSQLSRWVNNGEVIQLKRGVYALAEPYRTTRPNPFVVARRIHSDSCVSLETALFYHNVCPDVTQATTCIRPGDSGKTYEYDTPLGYFRYKTMPSRYLFGYVEQDGYRLATPEKALLDFMFKSTGSWTAQRWDSQRVNLDELDPGRLREYAQRFDKPRIVNGIRTLLKGEHHEKRRNSESNPALG